MEFHQFQYVRMLEHHKGQFWGLACSPYTLSKYVNLLYPLVTILMQMTLRFISYSPQTISQINATIDEELDTGDAQHSSKIQPTKNTLVQG